MGIFKKKWNHVKIQALKGKIMIYLFFEVKQDREIM